MQEQACQVGTALGSEKLWCGGPLEEQSPVVEKTLDFMCFPASIRKKIYEQLLIQTGPIQIKRGQYGVVDHTIDLGQGSSGQPSHQVESPEPALKVFRLSKAVYQESIFTYYRYNKFEFWELKFVAKFLNHLAIETRRAVSNITVHHLGPSAENAAQALVRCDGLKHLEIKIYKRSFVQGGWYPYREAQLHGQKQLLKIRGLKELKVHFMPSISKLWYRGVHTPGVQELLCKLQVMIMPRTQTQLAPPNNKDHRPHKAFMTVFGRVHLETRTKQILISKQSWV